MDSTLPCRKLASVDVGASVAQCAGRGGGGGGATQESWPYKQFDAVGQADPVPCRVTVSDHTRAAAVSHAAVHEDQLPTQSAFAGSTTHAQLALHPERVTLPSVVNLACMYC